MSGHKVGKGEFSFPKNKLLYIEFLSYILCQRSPLALGRPWTSRWVRSKGRWEAPISP